MSDSLGKIEAEMERERQLELKHDSAPALLHKAADIMEERGKQYDSPGGERSMAQIVTAFNAITKHKLSEADGWEFMSLVKQVRLFHNRNAAHRDSFEDFIAYAALLGECAATQGIKFNAKTQ